MAFSAQPRKPAWIMNKCLEALDYDVENQDVVLNGIVPEYEEKFSTIEEDVSALDTTVQGLDAEIDVLSAAIEAKEDVANKTTVVNSSSTDTQYPSAKAVYTAIQGGGSTPEASDVVYDNTESGLVADNVQDAIDEIHEEIEDIGTAVQGKLDATTAASTYQTISGMSDYLTTSTASSTYQTISGMSSYLTNSTAASTYQPISGMAAYLSKNEAGLTYQPISDMTNYQTKANMVQSVSTSATAYPSCYAVNQAITSLSNRIAALEAQIIHLTPEEWEETTPVAGKIYLVDEE